MRPKTRPLNTHRRTSASGTTSSPAAADGIGCPLRTTVKWEKVTPQAGFLLGRGNEGVLLGIAARSRLFPRVPQEEVERGQWLHRQEDLIRERASREADQHFVQAHEPSAHCPAAERQRKGTRNPARLDNAESALFEETPERLEREEARVRQIEDAALAVVELADEQHQTI